MPYVRIDTMQEVEEHHVPSYSTIRPDGRLTYTLSRYIWRNVDDHAEIVANDNMIRYAGSNWRDIGVREPASARARYVDYDGVAVEWDETARLFRYQGNGDYVAPWEVQRAPSAAGRPRKAPEPDEIVQVDEQSCPCEACKLMRAEGSKIGRALVHNYSAEPNRGWRLRKRGENDPYDYYLGVELETDNFASVGAPKKDFRGRLYRDKRVSKVDNGQAADMAEPKLFWLPKHDSSVSGPEFASHPATLTYWNYIKPKVASMFTHLLHAGYRSHDNDKCGMHINISRSAFDNARHLFRFLTLLYSNEGWSMRMSQRTKESAESWAPFAYYKDRKSRKFAANALTKRQADGRFNTEVNVGDKYCVFNAPFGEQRFEFRLPRGTLRLDRFYKNLEWVTAMIEFTRSGKVVEARPKNFMAWAMERRAEFPNLCDFFIEKKMVVDNAATI